MKFRKKPIVVDAVQYTGQLVPVQDFVGVQRVIFDGSLYIETPEGASFVAINDWIIKTESGEVYPIRAEVFPQLYEKVSGD